MIYITKNGKCKIYISSAVNFLLPFTEWFKIFLEFLYKSIDYFKLKL